MNPESDKEFEKNVSQLVHLLSKIVKNLPSQPGGSGPKSSSQKDASIQLNIHFFSFFPITGEEWDAMEDIYDSFPSSHEDKHEELSTDLNVDDINFLRSNGIRF